MNIWNEDEPITDEKEECCEDSPTQQAVEQPVEEDQPKEEK